MTRKNFPEKMKTTRAPLKTVLIIGLVLSLVISWGLVLFMLIWGRDTVGKGKTRTNTFVRELNDYDRFYAPAWIPENEDPALIERRLTRLQKEARSVEEQLSVLKRWRILASGDRRYIAGYRKAAREAAETFEFSAPLAAIASDSLVFDSAILMEDEKAKLKSYASRVSQSRFDYLELGIHILTGDLDNPDKAAEIPGILNLLSLDFSAFPLQTRKNLLIDEFLLRTHKGDIPGATGLLNMLLAETAGEPGNAGILRMAAEFFYDHRNPLKAAELYIRLAGDEPLLPLAGSRMTEAEGVSAGGMDLARAADALVYAGEIPGARNIWLALSSDEDSISGVPLRIKTQSLYNLSSSSETVTEETSWLEKLFSLQSENLRSRRIQPQGEQADILGIYSIIRYTRLLDSPQSIAVLEEGNPPLHPLLDLELLRRRLDIYPPNRASAEVWLLLGRNSEEEALHEWAAWYFDFQKLYIESSRLLKEASRRGMAGSWLELHRGLELILEGKTDEGEKVLREAYRIQEAAGTADWRIPANLGRIQESRRAISSALEYYEAASAMILNQRPDKMTAAKRTEAGRVQMRLSRCLEALGRTTESRRAMEFALELDPDNLNIRRELRRLDI